MFSDPLTLLATVAAFGLVLALSWAGVLFWKSRQVKQEEIVKARLENRATSPKAARTLRLFHEGTEATTWVPDETVTVTFKDRMHRYHLDCGFKLPLSQIFTRLAILCAAVAVGMTVFTGRVLPGLVAVFIILVGFWWHGTQRTIKRRVLFERQLVDALELSARALQAGHPLLSSFQLIAEEIPDPVGTVFADMCQQQALGVPMEEALRRSCALTSSQDMKLFSAALAIHLRTGGNLAEVMHGLAGVLRERMRLGRRFRVLIAQTQISKRILLGLPIAMFAVLNAISPDYMSGMYAAPMGQFLLVGAGVSMIIGWAVMNRMADIKV